MGLCEGFWVLFPVGGEEKGTETEEEMEMTILGAVLGAGTSGCNVDIYPT